MKVYFVGSISGKKIFESHYEKVIELLKKHGHQVTENTMEPSFEYVYQLSDEGKVEQYKNVLKWIKTSDLVIAEASHPSLGVGYEISLALERNKPVIVLYTEGKAPHFLEGYESEKLNVLKYTIEELEELLLSAIDFAADQADTRFNFFISPRHMQFLDYISQTKKVPRSVYLRQLIEEDREKNTEYFES